MVISGMRAFLVKFLLCHCGFDDFLLHPSRYSATAYEQRDGGQYIDHATFVVAFLQPLSSCGLHHSHDDDDYRLGVD